MCSSINEKSGSIHKPPHRRNTSRDSQQSLLADAKHGDQSQLGLLLNSYRNYLSILADARLDRKLRGRISPSDVVQETMLHALRDFEQFRGSTECEFLGWVRQILANTLSRVIQTHVLTKKRDVRKDVSIAKITADVERSSLQLNLAIAASCQSPSTFARQRERAIILTDVMSQLSADQREVLILRNMQGLKFSEVAELMGRSPAATKMLWMRAIKQLRKRYEHRDEG